MNKKIILGGFALTMVAGMINAVGLLGYQHEATSHLTGITSQLSLSIIQMKFSIAFHLFFVILSYLLGSIISGILIDGSNLKLNKKYHIILILESFILLAASTLLINHFSFGHFLAIMACGLQNAMATTYSGAIIRTTHMTGIITDMGILLGNKISKKQVDPSKLKLLTILLLGFFIGGGIGCFAFMKIEFYTLQTTSIMLIIMAFQTKSFFSDEI